MKVLLITGRADHGGGPAHVLDLIESWGDTLDVAVACAPHGIFADRFRHQLGNERVWPLAHRRLDARAVSELIRRAKAWRPNLIHSHGASGGWYGRIVAAALHVPAVHTFHGIDSTLTPKALAHAAIEQVLAPCTAAVIAVSAGEANLAARRYPLLRKRIHVINNGIEVEIDRRPTRPASESKRARQVIAFLRPGAHKNPALALAIAKQATTWPYPVCFDFMGVGLDEQVWRERAAAVGVATCRGPVDNPRDWLARSDVFLSTSNHEGMPLAVLEAWREGAVVVATDVVGNSDLVRHETNGLLYPPCDAQAGASAIRRVLDSRTLAATLSQGGWETLVTSHDRRRMASSLLELYQRLLRSQRRRKSLGVLSRET